MEALRSFQTAVGHAGSILLGVLVVSSACVEVEDIGEPHVDALPVLVAEEVARIGSFNDPNVGFTQIYGVDVDSDGDVYVGEASVPEIRVYAPDGDILRRIGGRGEGPGEFNLAPRFGVQGDTVWAMDLLLSRITLFDRQGSVVSTGRADGITVPVPQGFVTVSPESMRSDGKFIGWPIRLSGLPNGESNSVQPTDSIPVPFVLFDAAGSVADTIGWLGRPPPRLWRRPPGETDDIDFAGRRWLVPVPPAALPQWEPLEDGYVTVDTPIPSSPEDGVLTVTRIGVAADTVFGRRIHYRPIGYSDADLDSIAARAARGEPGGMVPFFPGRSAPDNWEQAAPRIREAMSFPEFQLPLEYYWVAQDESIWLRFRPTEGTGVADWVVLDPDGHPRGKLDLPLDIRPQWSRGDTVWASDSDELEVQWLVKLIVAEGV
jgi:hypothetical protein